MVQVGRGGVLGKGGGSEHGVMRVGGSEVFRTDNPHLTW